MGKSVNRKRGTVLDWIIRLVKGIVVGIGAILPGLSGGVMAVIFGIYDPLLAFLANLKKNFWKNVQFFIPVILGVLVGVLLFSIFVKKALEGRYEVISICLFIGFVVGTFPSLYKTAGKEGRDSKSYLALILAAVFLFALMSLGDVKLLDVTPNIPIWFIAGMAIGLGFIVPGLSPSNFLIYFGLYEKMADRISAFDLTAIIPLGLGVVVCALLFSKLMSNLLKKHYAVVYHIILGLVIGSTLAIFPSKIFPAFAAPVLAQNNWTFMTQLLLCVLLFVVGVVSSYLFSKLEQKYEHKSIFE